MLEQLNGFFVNKLCMIFRMNYVLLHKYHRLSAGISKGQFTLYLQTPTNSFRSACYLSTSVGHSRWPIAGLAANIQQAQARNRHSQTSNHSAMRLQQLLWVAGAQYPRELLLNSMLCWEQHSKARHLAKRAETSLWRDYSRYKHIQTSCALWGCILKTG